MLKPIRIQDKKAPRFRWTAGRYIPLNQQLFTDYKKSVENPVEDFSLFKDVIEEFNTCVKEAVLKNRDGVKLPAMMGVLAICSYRPSKRPPVNWKNSLETGLKLKEYNLHTAGLACKIVYSAYCAKYKFRNWRLWKFEGNRDFKLRVSTTFEHNFRYYKRMDNKSNVSKMFKDEYKVKKPLNYDNIGTDIEHPRNEQAN